MTNERPTSLELSDRTAVWEAMEIYCFASTGCATGDAVIAVTRKTVLMSEQSMMGLEYDIGSGRVWSPVAACEVSEEW